MIFIFKKESGVFASEFNSVDEAVEHIKFSLLNFQTEEKYIEVLNSFGKSLKRITVSSSENRTVSVTGDIPLNFKP